MADFCTKCAKELFDDEPNINIEKIFENLEPNHSLSGFLCEECGLYAVEKDESGGMILYYDTD